jgi:hypothetical protein
MWTNKLNKAVGAFALSSATLLCMTAATVHAQHHGGGGGGGHSGGSHSGGGGGHSSGGGGHGSSGSSGGHGGGYSSGSGGSGRSHHDSSSNNSSRSSAGNSGRSSAVSGGSSESGTRRHHRHHGGDGDGYRDRLNRKHRHERESEFYRSHHPTRAYLSSNYGSYAYSRDAYERGYRDGLYTGASDARRGQSYDPERSHFYRRAGSGLFSFYGNQGAYQLAYRDGFMRGYEEGYTHYETYFTGGYFHP